MSIITTNSTRPVRAPMDVVLDNVRRWQRARNARRAKALNPLRAAFRAIGR